MKEFHQQLKKAMTIRNITQSELCEKTNIPKSAMSQYISGAFKPKQQRTYLIAKALNVNESWLMGYDIDMERQSNTNPLPSNITPLKKVRYIPVLGRIACGEPIFAEENVIDNILLPEDVNADFALKCQGDSMINAKIDNGDTVFIRKQSMVENGEIAAVLIDDEATLKKVYLSKNILKLVPANDNCEPMIYSGEELNQIRILGKAVAVLKNI